MSLNVFEITDRKAWTEIVKEIGKQWDKQGCGICEQELKGQDGKAWKSPGRQWAHNDCFDKIWPLEKKLHEHIKSLFDWQDDRNLAHEEAVKSVKEACGSVSILTYFTMKGSEKLTHLFNTIGIKAVDQYANLQKTPDMTDLKTLFKHF